MQQGAKAASKRDRKDDKTKVAKSQLKVNEKAMDIQCQICKSTFLKTTRAPAYVHHHTLLLTHPNPILPQSNDEHLADKLQPYRARHK